MVGRLRARSLDHALRLRGCAGWDGRARRRRRARRRAELAGDAGDGDGFFVRSARPFVWIAVVAACRRRRSWWGWGRWWGWGGWASTVSADAGALDCLASRASRAAAVADLQELQPRFADQRAVVWLLGPWGFKDALRCSGGAGGQVGRARLGSRARRRAKIARDAVDLFGLLVREAAVGWVAVVGACSRDQLGFDALGIGDAVVREACAAHFGDASFAGVAAHDLAKRVVARRFVRWADGVDFPDKHEAWGYVYLSWRRRGGGKEEKKREEWVSINGTERVSRYFKCRWLANRVTGEGTMGR